MFLLLAVKIADQRDIKCCASHTRPIASMLSTSIAYVLERLRSWFFARARDATQDSKARAEG